MKDLARIHLVIGPATLPSQGKDCIDFYSCEITTAAPEGECDLRTGDRDHSARMPELGNRAVRSAPLILTEWVAQSNRSRARSMLETGVPDPSRELAVAPKAESRHRLAAGARVLAKAVLTGLHHEYLLATAPAIAFNRLSANLRRNARRH